MTSTPVTQVSVEALAVEFFQQSVGKWKSQRRYYTLKQDVEPQEVVSDITIRFLDRGSPELIELAQRHKLEDKTALVCGTEVKWESNYTGTVRKPSTGSTVFGIKDNILYRDRGFATPDPVIAVYSFINSKTLCLRTEYGGSAFEEEIKLIGSNYRTRQTIISRAGQELTIGQYLEKRISS
jgi:hypothetical protein